MSSQKLSSDNDDEKKESESDFYDEGRPLAIILVSSGSKGDRLLFRYPSEPPQDSEVKVKASLQKNPYASRIPEDFEAYSALKRQPSCIRRGVLVQYCDKTLANLLAVKSELCGKRLEMKIDEVRFVGFPSLLHSHSGSTSQTSTKRELPTMISFNVAFALRANATQSIIHCYQELAKQLAIALRHEERRCGYMTRQQNQIISIQDELSTMPEDSMVSPFPQILQKSQLAKHMKGIYQDLCQTGVVILRINKWIEVNYCMPFKVHQKLVARCYRIEPEAIQKCISGLRPYHAILLLEEDNRLLDLLPPDSSPALVRLIRVASPVKKLEQLALDADLALSQVFQLVSHLMYWAKAMIIYPLCESNVYMLSPNADTMLSSDRVEEFTKEFPGMSLPAFLSEFSLPTPYGEHKDVMGLPQQQVEHVRMVVWLLQHQLLMQLHTYVYLNVPLPLSNHSRATSQTSDDSLDFFKRSSYSSDVGSASDLGSPETSHASLNALAAQTSSESLSAGNTTSAWSGRNQEHLLSNLSVIKRQAILSVPAASNNDDLKLFARLCPYFNGKHHLEDIMFYENLRRSQLLTLIDKFRSVLLTCVHEDPVTAFHINCTRKTTIYSRKR
ncbi:GATOR1 complex protein NPRL3-like [Tubulanus polymorphus]|uniref:GATOR1 complex protein NPRL3-like n=1 Tax=Tubulanus polymorphus TaxID=672921 RepID=UPI003DA29C40